MTTAENRIHVRAKTCAEFGLVAANVSHTSLVPDGHAWRTGNFMLPKGLAPTKLDKRGRPRRQCVRGFVLTSPETEEHSAAHYVVIRLLKRGDEFGPETFWAIVVGPDVDYEDDEVWVPWNDLTVWPPYTAEFPTLAEAVVQCEEWSRDGFAYKLPLSESLNDTEGVFDDFGDDDEDGLGVEEIPRSPLETTIAQHTAFLSDLRNRALAENKTHDAARLAQTINLIERLAVGLAQIDLTLKQQEQEVAIARRRNSVTATVRAVLRQATAIKGPETVSTDADEGGARLRRTHRVRRVVAE